MSSSWFVGYTPQMSTAVMYVRGKGREALDDWLPTSSDGKLGYFGGNYPAKTWTSIMQTVMEGMDVEEFPEPVYVDGDAPTEGHEPYVAAEPDHQRAAAAAAGADQEPEPDPDDPDAGAVADGDPDGDADRDRHADARADAVRRRRSPPRPPTAPAPTETAPPPSPPATEPHRGAVADDVRLAHAATH